MRKSIFFLAASATAFVTGSAHGASYTYRHKGEEVRMEVAASAQGPLVNDICLRRPQRCQALRVFAGKPRIRRLTKAIPGNASGAYCELLGGTQLFARAASAESDTLFCLFRDLTLIDARELYRSHGERDEGGRK